MLDNLEVGKDNLLRYGCVNVSSILSKIWMTKSIKSGASKNYMQLLIIKVLYIF